MKEKKQFLSYLFLSPVEQFYKMSTFIGRNFKKEFLVRLVPLFRSEFISSLIEHFDELRVV